MVPSARPPFRHFFTPRLAVHVYNRFHARKSSRRPYFRSRSLHFVFRIGFRGHRQVRIEKIHSCKLSFFYQIVNRYFQSSNKYTRAPAVNSISPKSSIRRSSVGYTCERMYSNSRADETKSHMDNRRQVRV